MPNGNRVADPRAPNSDDTAGAPPLGSGPVITRAVGAVRHTFTDACEICGSAQLHEVRCKVICGNCRTILKSCADL
jgi:hypothetical protein